MKRIYLLIISFILIISAYASDKRVVYQATAYWDIDSLESILPEQTGIEHVNTLNRLIASVGIENFKKSYEYYLQAILLAEELKYNFGLAEAKRYMAYAYYYQSENSQCLNFLWEARDIYESLNDAFHLAVMDQVIATLYLSARDFDKALYYCKEAIKGYRARDKNGKLYASVKDTLIMYSITGRVYRELGRSDTALPIYLKYLEIGEHNNIEITNLMVHTGLVAACYIETKQYAKAIEYYLKALEFTEVNQSIIALKHEYMRRMAMIYLGMGRYNEAIELLIKSYDFLSANGFLMQSQSAASTLGEVFHTLNDKNNSANYFNKSDTLLEELLNRNSIYRYDSLKYTISYGWELFSPLPTRLMKLFIYENAVRYYKMRYDQNKSTGNKDATIRFLEKYTSAKDSLTEITQLKELAEIQIKYDTERKENEIINLSQENELKDLRIKQYYWFFIGAGGLLIIIVLFAIILIRQNKLRNSQQTLLLQQRLFRTQMKPHFLFNSLSSIQNFIIKKDATEASDYLSKFSRLMREILNSSDSEYVTLDEELDAIDNYLSLQKIRYDEMFDYSIEEDDKIDNESVSIPPMLAQPFIENAIEHGIKHKESKGFIKVSLAEKNNYLILEITDDGVGRKKASEIERPKDQEHKSMATSITNERLANLNKKLKHKIRFEIIDLKDDAGNANGTKVVFEIPLSL
ncbi:MAG: histidine kinase [Bacteroidetes bacterium]|nr:histidine kinase [Bacteroidota bacterium]